MHALFDEEVQSIFGGRLIVVIKEPKLGKLVWHSGRPVRILAKQKEDR
jgi:hypothetical protein